MNSPGELKEGMELSSAEFHELYLETGEKLRKVQLINGIVRMPSPVRIDGHERENCIMNLLMGLYCTRVNGVEPLGSSTLKLDSMNNVQADFGLRIEEGGLSKVENGDGTWKFRAYKASGCKEYIICKPEKKEIVWYKLVSGNYEEIVSVDGILKSEQFPGLHIDVHAVLTHNRRQAVDSLLRAIEDSNNHNG